jgi:hypothetical protein
MEFARVLDVDGELQICSREKVTPRYKTFVAFVKD